MLLLQPAQSMVASQRRRRQQSRRHDALQRHSLARQRAHVRQEAPHAPRLALPRVPRHSRTPRLHHHVRCLGPCAHLALWRQHLWPKQQGQSPLRQPPRQQSQSHRRLLRQANHSRVSQHHQRMVLLHHHPPQGRLAASMLWNSSLRGCQPLERRCRPRDCRCHVVLLHLLRERSLPAKMSPLRRRTWQRSAPTSSHKTPQAQLSRQTPSSPTITAPVRALDSRPLHRRAPLLPAVPAQASARRVCPGRCLCRPRTAAVRRRRHALMLRPARMRQRRSRLQQAHHHDAARPVHPAHLLLRQARARQVQ